ncbi:hypothetical protein MXB_671 [Myxobolus squamalis]|nr:hypothetical protein MXB_671 [Myxobolus squamalis]
MESISLLNNYSQPGTQNQPNAKYIYPEQGGYASTQQVIKNSPYGPNSNPQNFNPQPGSQNVPQFGQQVFLRSFQLIDNTEENNKY